MPLPWIQTYFQTMPLILFFSLQRVNQYATETDISATDQGITVSVEKIYYDIKQFNIQ